MDIPILKKELSKENITISQVANAANVVKSMVSMVLNEKAKSKKVVLAAENLLEIKKKEKGLDI